MIDKLFRSFFLLCAFTLAFATYAGAQSYPPVWSNTAKYVAGDMVTDYGNVYRCIKAVTTPYLDPSKSYTSWELHYVRNNTTLVVGVGQPFPNLLVAWNYAANCSIAGSVYLHFSLSSANGPLNETVASTLSLNHPFGANISILGDTAANLVLNFSNNGMTIDSGHAFGTISNLSLSGQQGYEALGASANSTISLLSGLLISNWSDGLSAGSGAHLICDSNVVLSNVRSFGISATGGSLVSINYGWSCTNSQSNVILYSSSGGTIYAVNVTLSGGGSYGADAEDGGQMILENSTIESCATGIRAINHSWILAEENYYTGNTYDLVSVTNSSIDKTESNATKNSVDSGTGSIIWG